MNLDRTYVDLLARAPEEGIIEVASETEHAALSGFTGNARGVRSWHERLKALEAFGLVRLCRGLGGLDQIILVHPESAMEALREKGKIDDQLWQQYVKIVIDTTGKTPTTKLPQGRNT